LHERVLPVSEITAFRGKRLTIAINEGYTNLLILELINGKKIFRLQSKKRFLAKRPLWLYEIHSHSLKVPIRDITRKTPLTPAKFYDH
jgi:hypothetical protein